MMKKAALLIGLNYVKTPHELHGCWNDVVGLGNLLLSKYAFDMKDIEIIADNVAPISKECILHKLYQLALQSWSKELDVAVFHYSGHGTQQVDQSGDEPDHLDEGICPCDFRTAGIIIDDDLYAILRQFNPKTKVLAVLDCCHSESILDLPFEYFADGTLSKTGLGFTPNIIMLSGCRDSETSADAVVANKAGGALTTALLKALALSEKDNAFTIHKHVLEYLKEGRYDQRPVLASSTPLTESNTLFS